MVKSKIIPMKKYRSCAYVNPKDYKNTGDSLTMDINGKKIKFKVYPHKEVQFGELHVMYKGKYHGCWTFQSKYLED